MLSSLFVFFFFCFTSLVSITDITGSYTDDEPEINVFSSVSKVAESSICTVRDFN